MSFEPKADSAFTDSNFIWSDHDGLLRYINQLRYERLMAKVEYFNELANHADFFYEKDAEKIIRIEDAYYARAVKLKRQM